MATSEFLERSLTRLELQNNNIRPIPNWVIFASITAILITTVIKLWTPTSLNRWPEAFFTITFLYGLLKERHWIFKHPIIIGLVAAVVSTIILFLINYIQNAELALRYAHFEKLIRVYLFLPIAYWLSFNIRIIPLYLFLSILGFCIKILIAPDIESMLPKMFIGKRVDFGFQNWQHLGMWSGIYVIVSGFLFSTQTISKSKLKPTLMVLSCISFSISLIGLYASQTRAAYLGLTLAIMCFGVVWFRSKLRKSTKAIKFPSALAILSASAIVFLLLFNVDNPLKKRFLKEQNTIEAIFEGDLSKVPLTSIGVRIHTWYTAASWIIEKPLVGWGGKVREDIVDDVPEFEDWHRKAIGHLHSTPFEFLASYGLIGTSIVYFPIIWLIFFSLQDRKNASSLKNFSFISLVFFIFIGLFESYLFFWPGAFAFSIIAAPLTAFSITFKLNNATT